MIGFERIRHISPSDLALLGLQDLAYIKPVSVKGIQGFGVYAADGSQMAVLPTREMASAAIVGNDLVPVSLH